MERTLGVSQSNLQPSCVYGRGGRSMHRAGYSISARCRNALTVPSSLPAWPWERIAAASQACLLPGEGSGERRVNAQLSPPKHMLARCELVIIHLGGFAFACTSTGKQAQPHRKHSAALQQSRLLPVIRAMRPGLHPSCNPGIALAQKSVSQEVPAQLHTPKPDIFRGLQRQPPNSMLPAHPFHGADVFFLPGAGQGRLHSQKKGSFPITCDRLGAPMWVARA